MFAHDSISDAAWHELMGDLEICGSKFGVRLSVNECEKRFEFVGDAPACRQCKAEVQQIMCYYFPDCTVVLPVESESLEYIADADGRGLGSLQSQDVIVDLVFTPSPEKYSRPRKK